MKNTVLKLSLLAFMTIAANANENNISNQGKFEGNIRLGYQYSDTIFGHGDEAAVGGYIKYETDPWNNLIAGASLYTTQGNGNSKAEYFITFFDPEANNYTLLSELYIKGEYSNTQFTIGRQSLETPFADSDDIGMIPNFFEALTITNKDIQDTVITAGYIRSMAGGGADEPNQFNRLNGDDGIYMIGAAYEGIEDLTLQGWYYHGEDLLDVTYLDAIYTYKTDRFEYGSGIQYAYQNFEDINNNIYGVILSINDKPSGLGAMIAYNKADGIGADNLFGGGPFFTNVEHDTLAEAGNYGETLKIGTNLDMSSLGINGMNLTLEHLWRNRKMDPNYRNLGFIAEYEYSQTVSFRLFYNDIKDQLDGNRKNLRVFADYKF